MATKTAEEQAAERLEKITKDLFKRVEEQSVTDVLDFVVKCQNNAQNDEKEMIWTHASTRVTKKTLLMSCCERGNEEMVLQIFKPYDTTLTPEFVNAKDINGQTALSYACKKNRTFIVKFLLDHGATLDAASRKAVLKGNNVWTYPIQFGNHEVVGLFAEVNNRARKSSGDFILKKTTNSFLYDGFDVNANIFENGETALIVSTKRGDAGMVRELLKSDDLDISLRDGSGKSAVDYALEFGRKNISSLFSKFQNSSRKSREIETDFMRSTFDFDVTPVQIKKAAQQGDLGLLRLAFGTLHGASKNKTKELENSLKDALLEAVRRNDLPMAEFLGDLLVKSLKSKSNSKEYENQDVNKLVEDVLKICVENLFVDCADIMTDILFYKNLEGVPGFNPEFYKEKVREMSVKLMCASSEIFDVLLLKFQDVLLGDTLVKCLKEAVELGRPKQVASIMRVATERSWVWPAGVLISTFVNCLKKSNVLCMRAMIENGFNANVYLTVAKEDKSDYNVTMWEFALQQKTTVVLEELLSCHELVDINCLISQQLGTPLLAALKAWNYPAINLILDNSKPWFEKLDPNLQDSSFRSALSYVLCRTDKHCNPQTEKVHLEVMEKLLAHNAIDLNTVCTTEDLRLINVCINTGLAKRLIDDDRLRLEEINLYGLTGLMYMCTEGRFEQVQYLVDSWKERKADALEELVNARDMLEGQTAIIKCTTVDRKHDLVHRDQVKNFYRCAEALLSFDRTDLHVVDACRRNLFLHACALGKPSRQYLPDCGDILDLLIKHMRDGNDIGMDYLDETGCSGLLYACQEGNLRSVNLLLRNMNPTQISRPNNNGISALDNAVTAGNIHLVKMLLEHQAGIDVNGRSPDGRSPLIRAVQLNHSQSSFEIVQLLVNQEGFNSVNKCLQTGSAALHILMQTSRDLRILKSLLTVPTINVNQKELSSGKTALMMACETVNCAETVIQSLLDHPDIDPNVQDNNGETALMHCIRTFNSKLALMLLSVSGIDINATNRNGQNVMHVAAQTGRLGLVKLLLNFSQSKLVLTTRDNNNQTAEALADSGVESGSRSRRGSGVDFLLVSKVLREQGAVSGKACIKKWRPRMPEAPEEAVEEKEN